MKGGSMKGNRKRALGVVCGSALAITASFSALAVAQQAERPQPAPERISDEDSSRPTQVDDEGMNRALAAAAPAKVRAMERTQSRGQQTWGRPGDMPTASAVVSRDDQVAEFLASNPGVSDRLSETLGNEPVVTAADGAGWSAYIVSSGLPTHGQVRFTRGGDSIRLSVEAPLGQAELEEWAANVGEYLAGQ